MLPGVVTNANVHPISTPEPTARKAGAMLAATTTHALQKIPMQPAQMLPEVVTNANVHPDSTPGKTVKIAGECWYISHQTRESPSLRCVSLAVTTDQSSIFTLATNHV